MCESFNMSDTARFRGLFRLLPLPWTKTTKPTGSAGIDKIPCSSTSAVGISTLIWDVWRVRCVIDKDYRDYCLGVVSLIILLVNHSNALRWL